MSGCSWVGRPCGWELGVRGHGSLGGLLLAPRHPCPHPPDKPCPHRARCKRKGFPSSRTQILPFLRPLGHSPAGRNPSLPGPPSPLGADPEHWGCRWEEGAFPPAQAGEGSVLPVLPGALVPWAGGARGPLRAPPLWLFI
ncbi:S100 calcium binding protein A16, partial [Columba livia]